MGSKQEIVRAEQTEMTCLNYTKVDTPNTSFSSILLSYLFFKGKEENRTLKLENYSSYFRSRTVRFKSRKTFKMYIVLRRAAVSEMRKWESEVQTRQVN